MAAVAQADIGEHGPGIAAVDSLSSTDDASWGVDIGGYAAGTEHDLLLVTGGSAALDGILMVSLADLGAGTFLPQIGDEFTILTALTGVSGTFANDPVSSAGGLTFEWSVIYNPSSVVLRLDNIVPAPGAGIVITGACALGAVPRRRR